MLFEVEGHVDLVLEMVDRPGVVEGGELDRFEQRFEFSPIEAGPFGRLTEGYLTENVLADRHRKLFVVIRGGIRGHATIEFDILQFESMAVRHPAIRSNYHSSTSASPSSVSTRKVKTTNELPEFLRWRSGW